MPLVILVCYVIGAYWGYRYVDAKFYDFSMPLWITVAYWIVAVVLMFGIGVVYIIITDNAHHEDMVQKVRLQKEQTEWERQKHLARLASTPNPGVDPKRRRTFEMRKRQARHKRRVSGVNN